MTKVLYEKDDRIGRITLNRPEVMNAIDDDLPRELAAAVALILRLPSRRLDGIMWENLGSFRSNT